MAVSLRVAKVGKALQVQPSPELLMHANQVVEAWSVLGLHPNLAVPRLAFVSAEMGGRPALFMAYDFYPSAVTLEAAHMQPQVTPTGLVQVCLIFSMLKTSRTERVIAVPYICLTSCILGPSTLPTVKRFCSFPRVHTKAYWDV